eukprot:7515423-Pyramimonas_sp.AAC.1
MAPCLLIAQAPSILLESSLRRVRLAAPLPRREYRLSEVQRAQEAARAKAAPVAEHLRQSHKLP